MNARLTNVLLVAAALTLVACGSGEAPTPPVPAIAPEPPHVEAPPAPVEEPLPAAPAAPPEAPAPAQELAPGGVLAVSAGSIELWHTPIPVDVVAYSPEVQEAILHQLRAALREALGDFDPSSGDPEYPDTFSASCDVTLALADLVSYACTVDMSIGRGGGDMAQATRTWEIASNALRAVDTEDLLVEGTDFEAITEPYDASPDGVIALTPTGIAFVDYQGDTAVVPYADLGTLLSPTSILTRVPSALANVSVATPLALAGAPPSEISVLAEPHPLPVAVLLGARGGSRWVFSAQSGTPIGASAPAMTEADATTAARLHGAARVVPWTTPARIGAATLRRATALHAGPHGRASGAPLPAGTVVLPVLGELAAGTSRMGSGQWALVVVSESLAGWLPSGALGAEAPRAIARVDALLAALPSDEARNAARPTAMAIGLDGDVVAHATTGDATTLAYFTATAEPTAAPRLVLTHAGALAEVRRLSTDARRSTPLLLVAWALPEAPTTRLWEVYALPASGSTPAAPLLTLTTPLPSVPARERVTLASSITRHGTFYPLVVRGPGRTETLYTWTNGTLVAPAPATP